MSSTPVSDSADRNDRRGVRDMPRLLSSNHVGGMAVIGRNGEKIGTIHSFMIDPQSGRIALAVVSLGGFLGLGESYHPLPWPLLAHNEAKNSFAINADDAVLKGGPTFKSGTEPDFDRTYIDRIWNYYGIQ